MAENAALQASTTEALQSLQAEKEALVANCEEGERARQLLQAEVSVHQGRIQSLEEACARAAEEEQRLRHLSRDQDASASEATSRSATSSPSKHEDGHSGVSGGSEQVMENTLAKLRPTPIAIPGAVDRAPANHDEMKNSGMAAGGDDKPKFMLYEQTEKDLKFNVISLREENARLSQDCESLRNMLVLVEDQVRPDPSSSVIVFQPVSVSVVVLFTVAYWLES